MVLRMNRVVQTAQQVVLVCASKLSFGQCDVNWYIGG